MKRETAKKPRGRPRAFDRQAALHRAMELFWAQGYEGTSIADLVATMGINPPSLYAAFGSKEALFLEAVEHYLQGPGNFLQRALEESDGAQSFIERLLRYAADEFTDCRHPAGCLIAGALLASPAPLDGLAMAMKDLRSTTQGLIEERLVRAQGVGELPHGSDCGALARFYCAVTQGRPAQARDGASREELLSVVEIAVARGPQPRGA